MQRYALNARPLDWYDYGARFYDPQIARFHTLDPLAESFPHQSPFVYADNNPIRFIDFMGMNAEDPDKEKEQQSTAVKVVNAVSSIFGYELNKEGEKALNSLFGGNRSEGSGDKTVKSGWQIFGEGSGDGEWNDNLPKAENPDSPRDGTGFSRGTPLPELMGEEKTNTFETSATKSSSTTSASDTDSSVGSYYLRTDTLDNTILGNKQFIRRYSNGDDSLVIRQGIDDRKKPIDNAYTLKIK